MGLFTEDGPFLVFHNPDTLGTDEFSFWEGPSPMFCIVVNTKLKANWQEETKLQKIVLVASLIHPLLKENKWTLSSGFFA